MIDPLGRFRCDRCWTEFRCVPGPGCVCPACGSFYSAWLDYPRFRAAVDASLRARIIEPCPEKSETSNPSSSVG